MTHEQPETETAVALIPLPADSYALFTAGPEAIAPHIARVRQIVATTVLPTADTEEGRRDIKSFAFKLTKTRTAFEDAGKKHAATAKELPKKIDATRAAFKNALQDLEDEVRAPVDAWVTKDNQRKFAHTSALTEILRAGETSSLSLEVLREAFVFAQTAHADRNWEEYSEEAQLGRESAVNALSARITEAEKRAAEQAELAELRAEKARRDQEIREREEAEAAQRREEEAKRREAEAVERAAEKARADERGRIAAEQAEAQIAEQKRQAKIVADQIIADQEAENAAKVEARRQQNRNHQAKIHREMQAAVVKVFESYAPELELKSELAKQIVTAMAFKTIPHVTINY